MNENDFKKTYVLESNIQLYFRNLFTRSIVVWHY